MDVDQGIIDSTEAETQQSFPRMSVEANFLKSYLPILKME